MASEIRMKMQKANLNGGVCVLGSKSPAISLVQWLKERQPQHVVQSLGRKLAGPFYSKKPGSDVMLSSEVTESL